MGTFRRVHSDAYAIIRDVPLAAVLIPPKEKPKQ